MEPYFRSWWYGSYRPNLERDKPWPVILSVDVAQERVVGFIGYISVAPNGKAGFSPGVDPAYQKRGIGKVLVHLWAKDVKEMGAVESLISTGLGNIPDRAINPDLGYQNLGDFCSRLVKQFEDS